MERHSFTKEGHTTSYLSSGPSNGPLLILLHGWPELASTWKFQLTHFGSLGFHTIAPDMPGYGLTSSPRSTSTYSLRSLVSWSLSLLSHLNAPTAIWAAHDWGSGVLWALAAHHPEVCTAVVSLCVPYRAIELGLPHLVSLVDRSIYPEETYPWGQWSYMRFYETSPEKAAKSFDDNAARGLKLVYSRGDPSGWGKPARTATVLSDGGWFHGQSGEKLPDIPLAATVLDEALYEELLDSVRRNGFWGANAYYLNHTDNAKYASEAVNGGRLNMPVLFVDATFDAVCTTSGEGNRLAEGMREYSKDLTEVSIEASHWVNLEKPEEVNAAVERFLEKKLPGMWHARTLV